MDSLKFLSKKKNSIRN